MGKTGLDKIPVNLQKYYLHFRAVSCNMVIEEVSFFNPFLLEGTL